MAGYPPPQAVEHPDGDRLPRIGMRFTHRAPSVSKRAFACSPERLVLAGFHSCVHAKVIERQQWMLEI
jgi:hypothetical protein